MFAAVVVVSFGLQLAELPAPAPSWPTSAGPAPVLRPAPVQEELMRQWLAQRRRLRIQFGVSAGVLGVSAVGLTLFVLFPRCGGEEESICAPPVGAIVSGAAVAGSLIASVVYMVRLASHSERRPALRRVGLAGGGLVVRF